MSITDKMDKEWFVLLLNMQICETCGGALP